MGKTRMIALTKNPNGYLSCQLYENKKRKKIYVHRLVMLHFAESSDKPCINHIDGNKQNNCIENLEWVTYSENMKHAIANGLNKAPNRWKK